ncbi:hypothetical protein JCM21900_001424 [Sporobolomyces salmonicolor]
MAPSKPSDSWGRSLRDDDLTDSDSEAPPPTRIVPTRRTLDALVAAAEKEEDVLGSIWGDSKSDPIDIGLVFEPTIAFKETPFTIAKRVGAAASKSNYIGSGGSTKKPPPAPARKPAPASATKKSSELSTSDSKPKPKQPAVKPAPSVSSASLSAFQPLAQPAVIKEAPQIVSSRSLFDTQKLRAPAELSEPALDPVDPSKRKATEAEPLPPGVPNAKARLAQFKEQATPNSACKPAELFRSQLEAGRSCPLDDAAREMDRDDEEASSPVESIFTMPSHADNPQVSRRSAPANPTTFFRPAQKLFVSSRRAAPAQPPSAVRAYQSQLQPSHVPLLTNRSEQITPQTLISHFKPARPSKQPLPFQAGTTSSHSALERFRNPKAFTAPPQAPYLASQPSPSPPERSHPPLPLPEQRVISSEHLRPLSAWSSVSNPGHAPRVSSAPEPTFVSTPRFALPGLAYPPRGGSGPSRLSFKPSESLSAFQQRKGLSAEGGPQPSKRRRTNSIEAGGREKVVLGASIRSVRPATRASIAGGRRGRGGRAMVPVVARSVKRDKEDEGESADARLRRLYRSLDL